jgi:23S rRNA (adenine2503-C2)-methyltransferase
MKYWHLAVNRRHDQLVSLDASNAGEINSNLFGLGRKELTEIFRALGEPAFRGRQVAEALYSQRLTDLSSITTLPQLLRQRLVEAGWQVIRPRIAQVFRSTDGTERYLIECPGPKAQTVETVWMPEGDGGDSGEEAGEESNPTRATICVSSQIGCAVNCQFCLTARLGLERSLTAGEIAGQVVEVLARHQADTARDRINLVFMGMGEPFLNYDNFMAAVQLLVGEVGLSPRRMTVSTSGILPGIERFAAEPPETRPRLAISLNAPSNQIRNELMPINRKWPIELVVEAVRKVPLRPRERVTFEYVLLAGVTDSANDARELARLIRRTGLPAKVNLIAWNPGPGIAYKMPAPESVEAFKQELVAGGISTYLRKPRGRDIYAACGQLKRTVEGTKETN